MSQHYFKTEHEGVPNTVVLGWDRRMSYFFMSIQKQAIQTEAPLEDEDPLEVEDDGFLYSNMDESEPFNFDLDYYRGVLRHHQIRVPDSMFAEVERDCQQNIGNRVVRHQADGSFVELAF